MDLLTPDSPGGLPTLSLQTNNRSWLPWGRVATPLISPLMPVPHVLIPNDFQYLTVGYLVEFHFKHHADSRRLKLVALAMSTLVDGV